MYPNAFPLQFEDSLLDLVQRRSIRGCRICKCSDSSFSYRIVLRRIDVLTVDSSQKFVKEKKLAGAFIFDSVGFKDAPYVYKAIHKELCEPPLSSASTR